MEEKMKISKVGRMEKRVEEKKVNEREMRLEGL